MEIIKFSDIVEENGKTIKENNMEIKHNIPIGSLVEVKYDRWHGKGACEKVHARLWVISHDRDCDGTPLYSLCENPIYKNDNTNVFVLYKGEFSNGEDLVYNNDISVNIVYNVRVGFSEESLTVINLTEELKKGENSLEWDENE